MCSLCIETGNTPLLCRWREKPWILATECLVVTVSTLIGLNLPTLTSAILTACAVIHICVVWASTSGKSSCVVIHLYMKKKIKHMRTHRQTICQTDNERYLIQVETLESIRNTKRMCIMHFTNLNCVIHWLCSFSEIIKLRRKIEKVIAMPVP
jgi:hypothetical protein